MTAFHADHRYYADHDHAACDACGVRSQSVNQRNAANAWLCYDCAERAEDNLRVMDEVAEEAAAPAGPMCPARFALWQTVSMAPTHPLGGAGTYGAVVAALRAHAAECAECGCTKKEVASDRELLDANAVCCLGEVA